jgi:hypothetical protein
MKSTNTVLMKKIIILWFLVVMPGMSKTFDYKKAIIDTADGSLVILKKTNNSGIMLIDPSEIRRNELRNPQTPPLPSGSRFLQGKKKGERISGKILGLEERDDSCVLLWRYSREVTIIPERRDDYFLITPDDLEKNVFASFSKELLPTDPVNDFKVFRTEILAIDQLLEAEKQPQLIKLLEKWSDVRGIAVLQMILDKKWQHEQMVAILDKKNDAFRIRAVQLMIEANDAKAENLLPLFRSDEKTLWTKGITALKQMQDFQGLPEPEVAIIKSLLTELNEWRKEEPIRNW